MSVQRKAIFLVVAVLVAVGGYFYFHRRPSVTDKDFIVIADFTNTTADRIFDDTLRQGLATKTWEIDIPEYCL